MGMYQNFQDIVNVLYFDEELLRLLYYSPANLVTNTPDPLDNSLSNIMNMDEEQQWNIRNERIQFSSTTNDLTPDKPICRIYVSAGRRRANGNYLMADQELVIDMFVHGEFENGDLRSMRISDRLNQLFTLENITGIGKMNYLNGHPLNSPSEYVAYKHVFTFSEFKK